MTNSVGIVGSTQSAPQPAPAGTAISTTTNAPAGSTVFKPQTDSTAPISPRIVVDPLAGAITEYLNTSGQVQSQIPSAAVVAYLRAGLTSDGFPRRPWRRPSRRKAGAQLQYGGNYDAGTATRKQHHSGLNRNFSRKTQSRRKAAFLFQPA